MLSVMNVGRILRNHALEYQTERSTGPEGAFPLANSYFQLLLNAPHLVRESRARYIRHFTERHLQCIWYNPDLRPPHLKTVAGETVVIEHPGTWNLESGPDFLGALLQINGDRHLSGDVEIHIDAADWKQHRHHENPEYTNVRVHVTYNTPQKIPDLFPPGTIHIALHDALESNPSFDFDLIDLSAYPYNVPGENTPCRNVLLGWTAEKIEALLDSAGEARLLIKSERMENELQRLSPDGLLYREMLAALGYKNNKSAFRLLAERVPLDSLRDTAGGDLLKAYALLAGVSGLLPADIKPQWPEPARLFLRKIWDIWWRLPDEWHNKMLPRGTWHLAGTRPANHPLRRLMAVASLFADPSNDFVALMDEWIGNHKPFSSKPFLERLQVKSNTWWDHHLSWKGTYSAKPICLIGSERAGAICANVLVPFYCARTKCHMDCDILANALPCESDNSTILQTAFLLFGRDVPESLYHSPLRRQGLIQIFQDFCLHDRSRCRSCPLPDHLRHFQANSFPLDMK